MKAFLLTLALGTGYFQVGGGGFRVHEIYRNRHDVVVGEYTQFTKQDQFVVWCAGAQHFPAWDENAARKYVQRCPGAND
ncbi:MAG TPA: hypothetical protein VMD97_01930 [Candidatus Aquilonibacter sp.]|nr:hypothetical protein [Candidatus Aquilonibacter sp.]